MDSDPQACRPQTNRYRYEEFGDSPAWVRWETGILREIRSLVAVVVTLTATVLIGNVPAARAQDGSHRVASDRSPAVHAVVQCAPGPTPSARQSQLNTTPKGRGPWHVPHDPCNTEPIQHWNNCAYWADEKRPDIWRYAVLQPGGGYGPRGGAWHIKLDAAKFGFKISHRPKVGDIAAWPPNAVMGTRRFGIETITHMASPGGHVAYVERVRGKQITISSTGLDTKGGYTFSFKYNRRQSYFIHRGR